LSFSGRVKPAQVFLQLSKNGKTGSFVAKGVDDQYVARLNLGSADVVESLSGAGEYSLSVLSGDSLLAEALRWQLGSINLSIADNGGADQEDPEVQPKKEIKHVFRSPEPRAPKIIALAFSLLVLAPLAVLVLTVMGTVRFSIPSVGGNFLWLVIFHGSIGAILFLYALYWIHLNIFQALAGLALLGPIATVAGNRALRALYNANQRQTTKTE